MLSKLLFALCAVALASVLPGADAAPHRMFSKRARAAAAGSDASVRLSSAKGPAPNVPIGKMESPLLRRAGRNGRDGPHENYETIRQRRVQQGIDKVPTPEQLQDVGTFTITQPLDHFDRQNQGTYNQTYWVNEQYWNGTGPAFIFLGGEWQESSGTLVYGSSGISQWASVFGGLMVDIQHRYYDGVNPPSPDGDVGALKYLSSQQALADAANIIAFLNKKYYARNSQIKWIHVGGSYAGNLAAWYRIKYPNLSIGAFAISGPVEATLDYTGFFAIQGGSLDPGCLNYTRTAVDAVNKLVADQKNGWPKLKSDMGVTFGDPLLATGMFGFTLAWDYLANGGICQMQSSQPDAYQALASMVSEQPTNYVYDPTSVWGLYSWLWYYQTCTEMGYYQTGSDFYTNPAQIAPQFLNPILFQQVCADSYGIGYNSTSPGGLIIDGGVVAANMDFTNTYYGGKNVTTTSTHFTHGSIDGWSAAGITRGPISIYDNSFFVIINGTHCSDLYFPSPDDPAPVKAAQQMQIARIAKWIA